MLRTGDYFGEIAIEYHVRRTATVICKCDCDLAVLDGHYYSMYIYKCFFPRLKEMRKWLKKCAIFAGFPKYILHIMAYHSECVEYPAGKIVFSVGQEADYIYFIVDGEVQLWENVYYNRAADSEERCQSLGDEEREICLGTFRKLNKKWNQEYQKFMHQKASSTVLGPGMTFGEDGVIKNRLSGLRVTQAL